MSRFFRQSNPHFILFGLLRACKRQKSNHNKNEYNRKLRIRINQQSLQDDRIIIIDILESSILHIDHNRIFAFQLLYFYFLKFFHIIFGEAYILYEHDAIFVITKYNRDSRISFQDFQNKRQIHSRVLTCRQTSSLRPYFHFLAFFLGQINTNFNRWRESYILFISKYSVNIY